VPEAGSAKGLYQEHVLDAAIQRALKLFQMFPREALKRRPILRGKAKKASFRFERMVKANEGLAFA